MVDAALALGLEALFGYPKPIQRHLGHPVEWVGAVILTLDETFNREKDPPLRRQALGFAALLAVTALGAGFGSLLEKACSHSRSPWIWRAVAGVPGLAQRSLYDHVAAVLQPLSRRRIDLARGAVAKIVGRDVEALDETGVVKAALETLAESFNDGVVAPAFWLAAGGLPALYAFKAISTADSMIGHLEPRWRRFGWASARADDLVNLVPARISGFLLAAAGGGGIGVMLRDAPAHASPNAGWPEAAMAGALMVQLGGPATYDGTKHDRPIFGAGAPEPKVEDLRRGLLVYRRACAFLAIGVVVSSLVRRRR